MKAETESESLSLSNMSKTAWGHMSNACGRLSLKPTELPSGDHTDSATIPKFSWTDEPEGNQSDRCVGHVPTCSCNRPLLVFILCLCMHRAPPPPTGILSSSCFLLRILCQRQADDNHVECSCCARYMPHLKALFPVGSRNSSLTWLEAGNRKK